MPSLVLGPLLRHVGTTDATVWVEASDACEVEVLGRREPTFAVEGRHYAVVAIEGLEPGSSTEYGVRLDGEPAWPEPGLDLPPTTIRTIGEPGRLRLAFGSCRAAGPHEPPYTRRRASDRRGLGIDALRTLALRTARSPEREWPDALLMLGDQVYADEPSVRIADYVASRQAHPEAPPDQLEDFEEYARAYEDAWSDPLVRWLLATVPSAMIFDDHEIHDEWKISQAWVDRMRAQPWYERSVTAGLMSYWLYQHLGNLSPAELRSNELLRRVRAADDGGAVLREYARDADRQGERSRWSFCRDFGRTRLVVLDARGGRQLEPGRRRILNRHEWEWVDERTRGDFDHLLVASSIPCFVSHGMHWLEAWTEAVGDGAWGRLAVRPAEWLRQRGNAGHWAAFQASFHQLASLLEEIAGGARGSRPASVILLSGDVHHCYLAEIALRRAAAPRAPVWQAVCSGLRKQIDPREKAMMKLANSRAVGAAARLLARAAGVPAPPVGWRIVEGPVYENQVATLRLEGESAELRVESTAGADWREPRLHTVFQRRLAGTGLPLSGEQPMPDAGTAAPVGSRGHLP